MTESTQHEDEAIKSAIVAALDMLPTPLFLSAVAVDRSTEFIIAGKQSYHLVADVDMVGPEKTVHLLVSAIRDYYSYYEDRRVTVKDDPRTAAGSAMTHDPLCIWSGTPEARALWDSECSANEGVVACECCRQCRCQVLAKARGAQWKKDLSAVEMLIIAEEGDWVVIPTPYSNGARDALQAAWGYVRRQDPESQNRLLGPHLEHHPSDPDRTRIWRDGEWVKP